MSEAVNPLLEGIKLPGRTFQLPSRGLFYHNGELAHNVKDGEVHVKAMSALDEITMKNADSLFSGEAVNVVFKSCIKGIEKPAELLSKDVDALMIFLRTVTYGPSYDFIARHACPDAKETEFKADLEGLIQRMKVIDPTMVDQNYTLKLSNGQVIKLRPNRYQQVLDLIKANENKKEITVEDQKNNLVMMLAGVIESVNEITDEKQIVEWLRAIPSPFVNRIAERLEKVNDWGSNLQVPCTCKECGQEFQSEIPINPVSFFTE
jgi:hypothetical protein